MKLQLVDKNTPGSVRLLVLIPKAMLEGLIQSLKLAQRLESPEAVFGVSAMVSEERKR